MATAHPGSIEIRDSTSSDMAVIEQLYPAAFPEEDLLPVVTGLLSDTVDVLSLVAMDGDALAGHVIFTRCSVAGHNSRAALLAPLAVTPARQRQGIGDSLARTGLKHLKSDGVDNVFVLGDPAYYGRFGFEPERLVAPPYSMPEEWRDAWQGLSLSDTPSQHDGSLCLPEIWLKPELWGA